MPRTTSDVIDQAIMENRLWEVLVCIFTGVFIAVGVVMIIWSLMHNQPTTALAGVVESALFWPALTAAMRMRKANIMLRLLEVPLDKAQTAAEAAEMLQRVFESHFREEAAMKASKLRAEQ
jgi:hypothetical protein